MSLINQMLQDLEKRPNDSGVADDLPVGVQSAKALNRSAVSRFLPLLGIIAVGAVGAGLFYWNKPVKPTTETVLVEAEATKVAQNTPSMTPSSAVEVRSENLPASEPLTRPKPVSASKTAAAKSDVSTPKPARSVRGALPEKRTEPIVPATGSNAAKLGAVAKTSPASEDQERAEQSYRNGANAYGQGRSTESIAQLQQALADHPGYLAARQLLVKQLVEQRNPDQARAVLRDGLQLQPGQLGWVMLLARLELDRGDLNEARKILDRGQPYAGSNADYQSLAGAVAQRQGKPDEAASFYRIALGIKPADGRSWIGLGLALEAEGHIAESREAFRRAVTTENLSPELQALAQRKLR